MENLTLETFKEKIFDFETNTDWSFNGTKPAIIDFYADWCAPCKSIAPIFEELSQEFSNIDFYKVDIDVQNEIAMFLQIRSIPAILFIPLVGTPSMGVGAISKKEFEQAIRKTFNIE
jgi:thioredoxin 1